MVGDLGQDPLQASARRRRGLRSRHGWGRCRAWPIVISLDRKSRRCREMRIEDLGQDQAVDDMAADLDLFARLADAVEHAVGNRGRRRDFIFLCPADIQKKKNGGGRRPPDGILPTKLSLERRRITLFPSQGERVQAMAAFSGGFVLNRPSTEGKPKKRESDFPDTPLSQSPASRCVQRSVSRLDWTNGNGAPTAQQRRGRPDSLCRPPPCRLATRQTGCHNCPPPASPPLFSRTPHFSLEPGRQPALTAS